MCLCGITHTCLLTTCALDRLLGYYLTGSATTLYGGSFPSISQKGARIQLREDEGFAQSH